MRNAVLAGIILSYDKHCFSLKCYILVYMYHVLVHPLKCYYVRLNIFLSRVFPSHIFPLICSGDGAYGVNRNDNKGFLQAAYESVAPETNINRT